MGTGSIIASQMNFDWALAWWRNSIYKDRGMLNHQHDWNSAIAYASVDFWEQTNPMVLANIRGPSVPNQVGTERKALERKPISPKQASSNNHKMKSSSPLASSVRLLLALANRSLEQRGPTTKVQTNTHTHFHNTFKSILASPVPSQSAIFVWSWWIYE